MADKGSKPPTWADDPRWGKTKRRGGKARTKHWAKQKKVNGERAAAERQTNNRRNDDDRHTD